jgi:hypothetical protein
LAFYFIKITLFVFDLSVIIILIKDGELNMKYVITIGREYGSGGRFIGRLVAEKLGIPFYDNELLI